MLERPVASEEREPTRQTMNDEPSVGSEPGLIRVAELSRSVSLPPGPSVGPHAPHRASTAVNAAASYQRSRWRHPLLGELTTDPQD